MTELATAYISIVPETSRIAPGVRKALGEAERQADGAGKSMGGRMSSALGTALKAGTAAAAAAGVATLGVAMTKGFQRLQAIDDAKGKLTGLGHSAASTGKIMDSALASVKGTAYGLGDAATLAASAVATGIKPGQELTKHLTMIGDAASIAGVGLGEMGSIFTKIQNGQRAYMGDLAQLADRGIPIYEWLGKAAGKSGEEIMKMSSKGQVSAQMVYDAINKNIGGAAQAAGKTVTGSFNNMIAALGRLGAAAQQPTFARLPATFTSATAAIDKLSPRVAELAKAFDQKVFDEWGPKVREALESARDSGAMDGLAETIRGLVATAQEMGPTLGRIFTELGRASASLGVSTWELFLSALSAASGALNALSPILSTVATLMEKNRAAVTALMAAWIGFKTIPGIVGKVSDALSPMVSRVTSARESMAGFGDQMKLQQNLASRSGHEIGRLGAAFSALGTKSQTVGNMAGAFYGASDGASRLSRSMSAAAAGAKGLGTSMVNAVGGPGNVAIMAATASLAMMASQLGDNRAKAAAAAKATETLAESHQKLEDALRESRGQMTDDVWGAAGQELEAYQNTLKATADTHVSTWERVKAWGPTSALGPAGSLARLAGEHLGVIDKSVTASNDAANAAMTASEAFDKLGMSNESVTRSLYGSAGQWETLKGQLNGLGEGGRRVASDLQGIRTEYENSRNAARKVTPGVSELSNAMKVLGDSTSTAADKSKALKSALDALNPARSAGEALAQHNQVIRDIAASTQEAIDQTQGFGDTLLSSSMGIDTATSNGAALRDSLLGIVDASTEAAKHGQFNAEMQGKNAEAFAALATQYGLSTEQIRHAADLLGYDDIELVVSMSGDADVNQRLAAISQTWKGTPEKKTISVYADQVTDETRAKLEALGMTVSKPMDGFVTITAKTDRAKSDILALAGQLGTIPPVKPVQVNTPGGQEVLSLLKAMNVEVNSSNKKQVETTAPLADNVIAKLKEIGYEVVNNNGKTVVVEANDDHYQGKKREWTETVYKQIIAQGIGFGEAAPGGGVFRGPGIAYNSDGSIREYAAGGIVAAEAFANGGHRLPAHALIQRPDPNGGLVQWAEPETGGEAFIPLAQSKRKRSTAILTETARRFGLDVVPQSLARLIMHGDYAGSLRKIGLEEDSAVVDGILKLRKFANGGFTGKQLRELADGGHGASRPLKGAPYEWGGINWGDCSSAMSAFALAAAGMNPFGARFTTASMATALQSAGFTMGSGSSGDMRIGWVNGGPGGGHTAGTLPDGTNVEMGGGYGGGMVGGTVGADDGSFTHRAFLRVAEAAESTAESAADSTATPTTTDSSTPTASQAGTGGTTGGLRGVLQKYTSDLTGIAYDGFWEFLGLDQPWWLGVDLPDTSGGMAKTDPKAAPSKDKADEKPKPVEKGSSAKTVREARDRVDDTERRLKVAKARLDEVEANPKAKASAKMAASNSVVKLERDLAQAQSDLDELKRRRTPSTTTPDRGKDVFDRGGEARGIGMLQKKILKPERVLSPKETQAFQDGMRRGFGGDNTAIEAKFDKLISAMERQGSTRTTNVTVADQSAFFREQKIQDQLSQIGFGG